MRRFFLLLLSCFLLGVVIASAEEFSSGKVYRLSIKFTGNRILTPQNSSLDDNAAVQLWTETNVNAQRWRFTDAGDGKFFLDNVYTGKRLSYQTSSLVQKNPDVSSVFKWSFQPAEGHDGYFYITNASRPGVLGLLNDGMAGQDGSTLRVYTQITPADALQLWKIEAVEEEDNTITSAMREEMMGAWKKRYFSWLKTSTGFWGEAELMEIILDAYEQTGREEYRRMFEEVYANFVSGTGGWGQTNGKNWMWNEYNDDIAWGVLASIRAHRMFGNHPDPGISYLTIAKWNFDAMYQRAIHKIDNLYYLLRWKEGQAGTTSCVNGPAQIAACYLGDVTGDDLYFQKAKMLYESQRMHMFEPSTGRVYDSFDNDWASTYNQGTYLGAAIMLYNRYGDERYKKDAAMIMQYSRQHLCDKHGIVSVCGSETGDYPNFKAILMRYARRYIEDIGSPDDGLWLQKNALHAYNNRNSAGLSRVAWWEKTGESNDWNTFGTCAAVSAIMNAPTDIRSIYKNAFSVIQAGSFNYISQLFSENNPESEVMELTAAEDGSWLTYNLVDCGHQYAGGIEVQLSNDAVERIIEVRLGSHKGLLLATITVPASDNSPLTVRAGFNRQLSGYNTISLVFKGSRNGLRFRSFNLLSAGYIYAGLNEKDITDDGGILSRTVEGETTGELNFLTDNSEETAFSTSGGSGMRLTYKAQSRYLLRSYSITSAGDSPGMDPSGWVLSASTNGTEWELLDSQENQQFDKRNATLAYTCPTEKSYQWFRIEFTGRGDEGGVKLAEWQLNGEIYSEPHSTDFTETALVASEGADEQELALLSDNDPATECTFSVGELPVVIEYELSAAIQMIGYSFTSGASDSSCDPRSWAVKASVDGTGWTQIDARSNQSFASRYEKKSFLRSNSKNYRFFRFEITGLKDANAQEMKLAEIELHGLSIHSYDLTSDTRGVLKAQWEGNYKTDETTGAVTVDERYTQLTDKSKNQKYLARYRKTFWVSYYLPEEYNVYAYSLTSANDAPDRDPRSWILSGSNNNSTWVEIDRQENQLFPYRYSTLYYTCRPPRKFNYYRLEVVDNQGEKSVQLGEWQLFGEGTPNLLHSPTYAPLLVYPNPATEFIYINTPKIFGEMAIYDSSGRMLFQLPLSGTETRVNVETLASGIYFIKYKTTDGILSAKFVKR